MMQKNGPDIFWDPQTDSLKLNNNYLHLYKYALLPTPSMFFWWLNRHVRGKAKNHVMADPKTKHEIISIGSKDAIRFRYMQLSIKCKEVYKPLKVILFPKTFCHNG